MTGINELNAKGAAASIAPKQPESVSNNIITSEIDNIANSEPPFNTLSGSFAHDGSIESLEKGLEGVRKIVDGLGTAFEGDIIEVGFSHYINGQQGYEIELYKG